MTTAAISAESAVMHIVGSVTAATRARQYKLVLQHGFVTRATFHALVTASERIGCLMVVIELPAVPTIRVMAGAALFAERALVVIPLGMAITADLRYTCKFQVGMTGFAGRRCMHADQWKLCEAMIERDRMPADDSVATVAAAVAALMRIVVFVAADAGFRQHIRQRAFVATFTCER